MDGESPNKTLYIVGTGAMADYEGVNYRPWGETNTDVTSIVIGGGVTHIGEQAFSSFTGLTTVTIPNNVTSIGTSAFSYCSSLTTVSIGSGVATIGNSIFSNCINLATITVDAGNTVYNSPDGSNAVIETTSKTLVIGCNGTTIPDGVEIIGNLAFASFTGLTSINIPASVTSIGVESFWHCTGLTTVTIPSSVTSIGDRAFKLCSNLSTVYILAPSLTTYGDDAFYDNKAGRMIYVPANSVSTYKTNWPEYANYIIGYNGPCGATGHESDVLYAMDGESPNKTLYIVGTGAMADYDDPDDRPWKDNVGDITSIVIGDGVTNIGQVAFMGCNNASLATVTIPTSVETIGNFAFSNCTGLTSVTIPDNVTSISNYAFYGCTGLTTAAIGSGVATIGNFIFGGCNNLATITVDAGNTVYNSPAGSNAVINTTSKTLVIGCKGTTIPDGVEIIGVDAFTGCTGLTAVTIPTSVKTIGIQAFYGCTGLTTIDIPASVETISDNAFQDCTGLTTVTIGNSVKTIGGQAFDGCSSLTSVILNSNPKIGANAFGVAAVTMNLAANPVDGDYWMTFFNDGYHFKADENTTVYKGTLSGNSISLTEVTDKIVTAGTAVILKSTGNPVMTLNSAASSDTNTNSLKGVTDLAGITAATPSTTYVLNYGNSGVGFYKLKSGKTLGYGKAYLDTSTSAPSYLNFEEDETTGIMAIDNGQLTMDNDVYDMQGRRVQNPTKGLYIVNGKMVVIK